MPRRQIRADIARWLLWECSKWFDAGCYVYLVQNVVNPILGQHAGPGGAGRARGRRSAIVMASILEAALEGREWLCADNPTIADIAGDVAAPMHLHAVQKLPLDDYPNIRGWIARVEGLPCWQNSDPVPHIPAELLAKLA